MIVMVQYVSTIPGTGLCRARPTLCSRQDKIKYGRSWTNFCPEVGPKIDHVKDRMYKKESQSFHDCIP